MSRELIVAGFHRSGTSFATQILAEGGLFIGDDLLGSMPSNPYGHFEDREVVQIHDRILAANGTSWKLAEPLLPMIPDDEWLSMTDFVHRRRRDHAMWGFKDPRVCVFLGVWKHVLPGAKTLLVYRSPIDTTYSLHRRHSSQMFEGFGARSLHAVFWKEPDLALRMWNVNNEALIRFAEENLDDVLCVSNASLQGGMNLAQSINRRWGWDMEEDYPSVFDPNATRSRRDQQAVEDQRLVGRTMRNWDRLVELEAKTAMV